jgi:hypothetical protein
VINHPFQTLTLSNGAKLIFTPCPGSQSVGLDESMGQLKHAGVSMLLTLMFEGEMLANNISTLPSLCNALQITWLHLPIVDDEAPQVPFEQQWVLNKALILEEINNKGVVAVHCKGGTGRTGTVIALILLQLGWSALKIQHEVQRLKPKALKINKQIDYLNRKLDDSVEVFYLAK